MKQLLLIISIAISLGVFTSMSYAARKPGTTSVGYRLAWVESNSFYVICHYEEFYLNTGLRTGNNSYERQHMKSSFKGCTKL
ncbi:hypothetical protein DM558_01080 [Entomomonas moraniae]|uniref:Uncharacterized protein n=1 Tax=Entomomonas moraniae TaxID=2213226 RepID=A0A3S9XAI3_9GAMM|nr:hypothetical protein [Entomomonas moraniae]AZS49453.1 hypothetical protein DM558_01080 [Entomomonas moraniae]